MKTGERKDVAGRLALFTATLIWGSSFVVMKDTLASLSTFYILAFRFSGAAILLALFMPKRLKSIDRGYIKSGFLMGTFLLAAYALQTLGLSMTTPGKNAFLTAVYCVLVPFMYWTVGGRKPDRYNLAAALVCVAGIGFVSLDGEFSVNPGDLLTLLGGVFFGLHIVVSAKATQGRSILLLTMLQFAFAAAYSWVFALIFEPIPSRIPDSAIFGLVYLCVLATAVALALQCFGQKYTPPAAAAIIMTFESVFGALVSIAVGKEVVTFRLIAGFLLIFCSVVISETKLSFLPRPGARKLEIPDQIGE